MPLTSVKLSAEVYLLFTTFALCTEREECVALLLGTFEEDTPGTVANVKNLLFPSERREKKRDRVEISDADMTRAMSEADRAGLSVIGWCHSHPHITVLPSHVDLRTQLNHQAMDDRWFGIIVSCFSGKTGDIEAAQRIQINCFQSRSTDSANIRIEVPLYVTPSSGRPLEHDVITKLACVLPELFFNEEETSFRTASASLTDKMSTSYNSNLYIQMLTNLIDKLCAPLLATIQLRHQRNLREIETLQAQLKT
ncbi:hypothetical protein SmJEL517_g05190 [Synchytrium microbalum]|uniref:MPN domain-containing protein n=1 Tax=Synchytrium microbalum TaxID=1806994 RepID=A0A507BXC4_9FUNG|nr:uncharacterized protein SmJEL517_g05190 [Synchytrium microbalum]TPX31499.1 hypothetical protein SmJEL517_g05190 [Synchytrium microbalum]